MLPEHVAYRQKSTCPERTLRKLDARSILLDASLQFLKTAPRRFGAYATADTARWRRFRWLATSRSTVPRQANALLCRNSPGGAWAQTPGGWSFTKPPVRPLVRFPCPTIFRQASGKHGLQPTRIRLQEGRSSQRKSCGQAACTAWSKESASVSTTPAPTAPAWSERVCTSVCTPGMDPP